MRGFTGSLPPGGTAVCPPDSANKAHRWWAVLLRALGMAVPLLALLVCFGGAVPAWAQANQAPPPAADARLSDSINLPFTVMTCQGPGCGPGRAPVQLELALPARIAALPSGWNLLVDNTRFHTIIVAVRHHGGTWRERLDAGMLGRNWAFGNNLRFVVPVAGRDVTGISIGFEGLDSPHLLRRVKAMSTPAHEQFERKWLVLVALVMGMLFCAFSYNGFLLTWLNSDFQRWYVLWLLAAAAYLLVWTGTANIWLPVLAGPYAARVNFVLVALLIVSSTQFFYALVEPGLMPERLVRWGRMLAMFSGVTGLMAAADTAFPPVVMDRLFNVGLALASLLALISMWVALQRGSRTVRFYLAGWAPALLVFAARLARNFGILPQSDLIDMASFAAIGWESLLLSLAIADRFRSIRQQHDEITAERTALARAAATDALTGLANRNAFQARLDQPMRGRDGADLILFDVDFLKQINDQAGHDAGDALIAAVARRLRGVAGEAAMIARIGGDEFVVLLEGPERTRCDSLLALVDAAGSQPVEHDGQVLQVSFSAGHAALTAEQSLRQGYKQADLALYRAKASGRGCWRRFTPDMADADDARTRFLAEAQTALDENSLRLAFQPMVLIDGRRPLAMRAQLQWQHPRLGRLGLEDALDAFGEVRLAGRFQAWQLDQALGWLARQRDAGQAPPAVALELLLPQALVPGLPAQLQAALGQHGLPASALWLLVPADTLTAAATPVLAALHNAGLMLVLSGFGVGQASMTALRDVPAGWILLDPALTAGLADDAEQQQWVSAVVALAHRMGRRVMAPGVARETDARALRAMAVDAATGPLFADAGPKLVAVPPEAQGRAG